MDRGGILQTSGDATVTPSSVIYLDNAATTYPKPEVVYLALNQAAREAGGNALRGSNPLAVLSTEVIYRARTALSHLFGVSEPDRVVFSPSATIALNQLVLGADLPPNAVVYVSPFEHNSVLRTVEHQRLVRGWRVQQLTFDPLSLEWDDARTAVQFSRLPPDFVVCTQASNVFGVMPNIDGIATMAKRCNPNAIVVVDGAQAAGLYPLDLSTGLIDFLVFSGHKSLHGPFGVGGFVVAGSRWPRPILFGGTGTRSEQMVLSDETASTYEVGSPNVTAVAGLLAAVQWLTPSKRGEIREYVSELTARVESGLGDIPEVTLFRSSSPKIPVISFDVSHISPQEMEQALGARGFAVRAGLHCAPLAHQLVGTLHRGGTTRVSPGAFNTVDEINAFVNAVEEICST